MDDLRRYIAKVIMEVYRPPALANKINNMALLMSHPKAGADRAYFVLTRTVPDNKLVFHSSKWKLDLKVNRMVAAMKVRKPATPCNGAYEIAYVAADEGFGPTLYDIVMGWSPGGLISDRGVVSMDAEDVWLKYFNDRPDVEKTRLDPYGEFTPERDDDCNPGQAYDYSLFQQAGIDGQSIGKSEIDGKKGYYYGLHSSYSYSLPPQEIDKMIARGKPIIDALVRDGVPVTEFMSDVSASFFHARDY